MVLRILLFESVKRKLLPLHVIGAQINVPLEKDADTLVPASNPEKALQL